ncbi:putative uroporphyrinogen-III C-methyltransferase [Staphylotrichum tortipilum]|uniref:Uroporphyrinogen-III C-methyltransferase n=1 Tax=Staphylotrichum tortipilum TaxID=2831512 RepID=A0AAN6MHP5_9PEZI|nr:putative uroporphyrinogen-III C-methyltransferase [Staphylotrichum longicolle]
MAFRPPPAHTSLLTAQHCAGHVHLILGANPLAAARASASLAAGAKPILISPFPSQQQQSPSFPSSQPSETDPHPQLHYSLASLITAGSLTHLARPFATTDLFTLGRAEADSVVDAVFVTSPLTPSGEDGIDNAKLAATCARHRIPLNVVDAPALCSFSLLSMHVDGPLQIGVTTNGRGCKLAGRIRREVAAGLPTGLGAAVGRLGEMRRRVLEEEGGEGGGVFGVEDAGEQGAALNQFVMEGGEGKMRRMRWLSQVCEYWPLRKLAQVTDEEVEGILKSYPGRDGGQKPGGGGGGGVSVGRVGRVILAGSGPGHPDLLTRATYKAMQSADLILADKLVPAGVLDLIPRRTPVSIARKFPGNADRAQEELLEQALEGVRAGKTVLRLKQGDPFIYGRGGEEVAFFREHGLADRVVVLPGITSALSAPLFAGVPPTQRDVADQVLVCTGTGKKGRAPQPPEYVGSRTVVFLMALHRIGGLVGELTKYTPEEEEEKESTGSKRMLWPLDTPCAVIERASCPDQRVIRTTLRFVEEAIEQEGSRPPGLLVVGKACEALYTPEKGRSWVVEDGFKGLDLDLEGGFAAGGLGIAGMA